MSKKHTILFVTTTLLLYLHVFGSTESDSFLISPHGHLCLSLISQLASAFGPSGSFPSRFPSSSNHFTLRFRL
ncbi:hypothetical protein BDW68DRAFT_149568 [Aspergillus falconensis]